MSGRSYYDNWRYRLRLFGRTVWYDPVKVVEEQPTLKIRLLRIRAFFSAKLPAMWEVLLGFVIFTTLPVVLFAVLYHALGVTGSAFELVWGSFQMFTVIGPTQYDNGVVSYVLAGTESLGLNEVPYADAIYVITCIESIVGKVTDAVFLGAMTAAMLHPVNRLWVPGRFAYNGRKIEDLDDVREAARRVAKAADIPARKDDLGTLKKFKRLLKQDRLEFSYWLRLTEEEWLHNVHTTLRVQSDEDDRQIKPDAASEPPMFEHHTYRVMRRGTNFIDVHLDDRGRDNSAQRWILP